MANLRSEKMKLSRQEALAHLEKNKINPFPAKVNRTHLAKKALVKDGLAVTVAGRIMAIRGHGKLIFANLIDRTDKIQLAFKADNLDSKSFELIDLLDIGDFVEVTGTTFTTKTGERTVNVNEWRFLSKSMTPMPPVFKGMEDKEERFRKRFLDLLLNPASKQLLDKRWAIEKAIREYLWSEDYHEVETPVLQNLYGGTNAKPFTTHLNALDQQMYLRVAPELYLKRLIVGGYERIFEIARNFRNEGMDQTHQPEFTMMEFYEAYADYYRIMDLTEGLFKSVAQKVNGSLELMVGENKVNLSGAWERITIEDAMKKYLNIDWQNITDNEIQDLLILHKIKVGGVSSRNKALFAIFDHLVPSKLIQPTWVIDYPAEVSPLAKSHRSKEGMVERFEGYIGGKEICDGWSEIVSPIEQRSRFDNEQKNMKAGDAEAQPLDEDFLESLSYGCPPLGGIGIGIDRLVMFLTNTWSIREVIAFPLMRPKQTIQLAKDAQGFRIDDEVKQRFTGMFYAYTTIKGVEIGARSEELEKLKQEIITKYTPSSIEAIGENQIITAYRNIFKATKVWGEGRRPSPEALLRRLAQGKGLYTINTAVDAYNLAVIESFVGLGGFDLDRLKLPIKLRFSKEGELIHLLGDQEATKTKAGEMVYSDQEKLITLDLNYRDLDDTKITDKTKNIILFADGAPNLDKDQVLETLSKGVEYIHQFCGGEIGEFVVVE